MKFIASAIIPMGAISSSENRSVKAVNEDNYFCFLLQQSEGVNPYLNPQIVYFDKSSKLKIIRAKIDPIYAEGLREAKSDSLISGYCARVVYGINRAPAGGYERLISSFIFKFGEWAPVEVVIDPNQLRQDFLRVDPATIELHYDAYQIKDEYKGQNFAVSLSIEFECSGVRGG